MRLSVRPAPPGPSPTQRHAQGSPSITSPVRPRLVPIRGPGVAPRRPPARLVLGGLIALLLAGVILGVGFGSVAITPGDLFAMLIDRLGLMPRLGLAQFPVTWRPQDEAILFDLRLPRVIGAGLVGVALAAAGVLFQGLLRNPLADPYVIGTSGGASLGAVIGIIVSAPLEVLGFGIVPITACLGALSATLAVTALARIGGRTPVVTLLLAGFAVSSILTYAVSFLLIMNDRLRLNLPYIYSWLLGGVSVTSWTQLAVIGPLVIVLTALSFALGHSLNALSLGDEAAERLGVAVEREKLLLIFIGSVLTAAAVTISGMIGFVGLVVPHVLRLLIGPDHRLLLPATALAGAAFLILADLIARAALAPSELPVGIVTALLGGPYFLYLLRRTRREYRL